MPIYLVFGYNILPKLPFSGLAVKTGSIALQKVYFLFLFWFGQKSMFFWGRIVFSDSSQKRIATLYPYFCYIFSSFGVKNICALFREID